MPISLVRATLLAATLAIGCGEAPRPAEETAPPKPSPQKKVDAPSRADEIIADLKKREAEQAEIQKQRQSEVPVVIEVSPEVKGSTGSSTPSGSTGSAYPAAGSSSSGMSQGKDANYWRQEFSIAQARLTEATSKLDAAKIRMNNASSQLNDPNTAISRMARDSYNTASAEVSQLQSAVYSAQSYLDNVRYNAIQAGVPPGLLR